jgi:hypothetical protein
MSATEGVFAEHSRLLNKEAELHVKKNTALAYDRKIEEFKLYSRHAFRHLDVTVQETVTEEKLFGFLLYNSRRAHFPRGSGKKGINKGIKFDHMDYDRIMEEAKHLPADEIPYKVLNWSQMANYNNAILKLLQFQRDMGANSSLRENLHSGRITKLLNEVNLTNNSVKRERTANPENFSRRRLTQICHHCF